MKVASEDSGRFSTLSLGRQRLVREMQTLGYGRLHNREVFDGEPVYDPPPMRTRVLLLGGRGQDVSTAHQTDFVLKKEHRELFVLFDREQTLLIEELVVENGLPIRVVLSEVARI